MMGYVLGELDIVNEVYLMSDKLGIKEIEKMELEFNKVIKQGLSTTKQSIWNYAANAEKKVDVEEELQEDKKEMNVEVTIS